MAKYQVSLFNRSLTREFLKLLKDMKCSSEALNFRGKMLEVTINISNIFKKFNQP